MRRIVLVLVLASVLALGGCKRKRTDDRPEVDRRELEDEMKRIAKGDETASRQATVVSPIIFSPSD